MYIEFKNGKEMAVINNKFWGVAISDYGLEHHRLDFLTMINAFTDGCYILNNTIINAVDDWEIMNGIEGYDEESDIDYEVFQYFIISAQAARNLIKFTNELVYYSETLDLYLLGVTHCGTGWDYVLTDYELREN